jgi:hypothetical protein
MPAQATPEQLSQLESALSVGEALIYLRNSHPKLSERAALDQAFASLAAADGDSASAWLSEFNVQQDRTTTLVAMRSRAAAASIVDALARSVGFLGAAKEFRWRRGRWLNL